MDPDHSLKFAVDDPIILAGVLIGAMMPLLFAALTMISVGKAAAEIIIEAPLGSLLIRQVGQKMCVAVYIQDQAKISKISECSLRQYIPLDKLLLAVVLSIAIEIAYTSSFW